jgi:hypothetical protein
MGLMLTFIKIFLLINLSMATIFEFSDLPLENELFDTADFTIYISDDIDTIKGIYMYMHGFGGDSRSVVYDEYMIELSDSANFALMGVRLDNMHMDSGIGNSLLDAKHSFAEQSNHPELVYSPFFFEGYSWGGQWSYHYAKWRPNDVLAFITMKGGYHDTTYAGNAINIPAYLFIGENDLDYRIENLTNIFLNHRQDGALWALAMERGTGHSQVQDRILIDRFFFDIISARIPNSYDINHAVPLIQIEENDGWVGNRDNYLVYNYECLENTNNMSWLLNVHNAINWQNFVSNNEVSQLNDCNIGDMNFDGITNVLDILLVIDIIMTNYNYNERADINYDLIINIQDIIEMINVIANT